MSLSIFWCFYDVWQNAKTSNDLDRDCSCMWDMKGSERSNWSWSVALGDGSAADQRRITRAAAAMFDIILHASINKGFSRRTRISCPRDTDDHAQLASVWPDRWYNFMVCLLIFFSLFWIILSVWSFPQGYSDVNPEGSFARSGVVLVAFSTICLISIACILGWWW